MNFQKKNMRGRSEKVDFFESDRFLRQCLLNKKNYDPKDNLDLARWPNLRIKIRNKSKSFHEILTLLLLCKNERLVLKSSYFMKGSNFF
jgi:hypothetical protein